MDLVAKTQAWIAAPFREDMDLVHYFFFTGAILVFIYVWGRFINRIA